MNSPIFLQCIFLFILGVRSIFLRPWVVLFNAVGTIVTVTMLLSFLAVKTGFQSTLAVTGDEHVAMVLREGAQAEISSVLTKSEMDVLMGYQGIEQTNDIKLISPELYVMVDIENTAEHESASIPLRGLAPAGIALRKGFRLRNGRLNEEGKNEILVGQSLARKIPSLAVGNTVTFGKTNWLVTGVFDFGGELSAFEGEMWTDNAIVQSQFKRGDTLQSVRIGLQKDYTVDDLKQWSQLDKRLAVQIKSEKQFYQELSEKTVNLIFYIAWPLSIVMAIGALAGALNLMHTAVQSRAREIAILLAVGFKKFSIVSAIVSESMLIALVSAVIGCLLGYALFDGVKASMLGSGHAQIFYTYHIGLNSCLQAVSLALILGFLGGLAPALKATRGSVRDAFSSL